MRPKVFLVGIERIIANANLEMMSEKIQRHTGEEMKKLAHVILGVALAASIAAAGTSGKISGKLVDTETGEPFAGCNIMFVGTTFGGISDHEGRYYILNIPPGTYAVDFRETIAMSVGVTRNDHGMLMIRGSDVDGIGVYADNFISNDVRLGNPDLSVSKEAIQEIQIIRGGFSEEDGYNGLKNLIKSPVLPEAIFSVAYPVALGIYAAASEHGIKILGDIDIVCFGASSYQRFFSPSITFVRQPTEELGRRAIELLLNEIRNPESIRPQLISLPTELVLSEDHTKERSDRGSVMA